MYSVQNCSLLRNPGGERIEVDADSIEVNSMEIVLMPARKALVAFGRKCCFDAGAPHDALSVGCAWASNPPNFTSLFFGSQSSRVGNQISSDTLNASPNGLPVSYYVS